jgi:hypothetical protein
MSQALPPLQLARPVEGAAAGAAAGGAGHPLDAPLPPAEPRLGALPCTTEWMCAATAAATATTALAAAAAAAAPPAAPSAAPSRQGSLGLLPLSRDASLLRSLLLPELGSGAAELPGLDGILEESELMGNLTGPGNRLCDGASHAPCPTLAQLFDERLRAAPSRRRTAWWRRWRRRQRRGGRPHQQQRPPRPSPCAPACSCSRGRTPSWCGPAGGGCARRFGAAAATC